MYQKLQAQGESDKRDESQAARRDCLYASIWKDVSEILRVLLPGDKGLVVSQHSKSIFLALVELKTGKRPNKF
ncbi:MAG: hypothetical protein GY743_23650 [Planctomycetaceae bacterium]|nr:hypothetical protein [Planctomycetaceae bacterium]